MASEPSQHPHGRILLPPEESFFLFGARGTGKSTWLREALGDATSFDLLDETLYQELLREPGRFADYLRPLPRGARVVVDEVQRLPALLNEVHRAIERQGLRFALTGSSARKLRRAGTNLLGGRAERREMFPFVPAELGRDFQLEEVLRFGSLPLVWSARNRRDRLRAYAELFLREEVQAEALVRNLAGFARFLPVAALFHGQVLNLSSIARDAGVGRATVEDYFQILVDAHQGAFLPAYEARLRVRERKGPKWYWTDAGVVRAMKGQLGEVAQEERGALFEGTVAMMLRAHNAYSEGALFDTLSYWAPAEATQTEVDFVMTRGRDVLALEVKSGARVRPEQLKGLRAIAELAGLRRRVVVTNAPRSSTLEGGIEVWTFERFATALAKGTLWP